MIRVKHVEWLAQRKGTVAGGDMYIDLSFWATSTENYTAHTTIWALDKIINIAVKQGDDERLADEIKKARAIINREEISLSASEFFSDKENLENWLEDRWKAFEAGDILYASRYFAGGKNVLIIKTRENMLTGFEPVLRKIPIDGIGVKIIDDNGYLLYGSEQTDIQPFITSKLSDYLPGWNLQLYFEDGEIFENAASRQAAVYMWSGLLVTLLIIICGAVAAQSIGRQMRLNKLKNDFVATVTHELRTPLASMRVLVDTLLEGNYRDQATVTEYLRLVSKENERLSRLIDNFLGFSRMERNKQAFEVVRTSPVSIANSAAEAFRTKFNKNDLHFNVKIEKPLPMVGADEDAMVTVLVNLMENAYKYSGQYKNINLHVYSIDGNVCFSVSDNGIGIPRRAINRIFKRFYQVDRSLSRRAEGCGLGLSIVKFIVDAHKGRIEVKSEQGKGSIFTVKLPAERISQ